MFRPPIKLVTNVNRRIVLILGIVTSQNVWNLLAPSTSAASNISGLIPKHLR